jgi:hypothetical protein
VKQLEHIQLFDHEFSALLYFGMPIKLLVVGAYSFVANDVAKSQELEEQRVQSTKAVYSRKYQHVF